MRNFAPAGNGPVPSCLPLPFELDESEDFADQDAGLPAGDTGSDIISLTSAEPSNSRWDNAFISPNDLANERQRDSAGESVFSHHLIHP